MLIYWRLSYSALKWWGYSDLNREALRHWILNPACLPISPYPRKRARLPYKHHVDIGTNLYQKPIPT